MFLKKKLTYVQFSFAGLNIQKEYMNIEHMSVSRHGVWDLCRQQYKYQYHIKLETNEPEPFYFVYGKIIHKIAEEYVACKGERLLSEVAVDVLEGRIEIERQELIVENEKRLQNVYAPPLPDDYRRRMPEHLRSIKYITDKFGTEGLLEHKFEYDLDPPNRKIVKGFIDRLVQKNDKWFILDYKTTKKGMWRKDENTIKEDLQLRTYARVVQKQFNVDPKNIYAALYYLEGGNLIGANYNEASLAEAENILLTAYNEISDTDPGQVRGHTGNHCFRCKFKRICPYFNMD